MEVVAEDFVYPHEMILEREFYLDIVGNKCIRVGIDTKEPSCFLRRESFGPSIKILDKINGTRYHEIGKGAFIAFLNYIREFVMNFLDTPSEGQNSVFRGPYLGIVAKVYFEGNTHCLSLIRNEVENEREFSSLFLLLKGMECRRLFNLLRPIVCYNLELEKMNNDKRTVLIRDWFVESVIEVMDPINCDVFEIPLAREELKNFIEWEYSVHKTSERIRRNIQMYDEIAGIYDVTHFLSILSEINLKMREHITQCVLYEMLNYREMMGANRFPS